MQNLTGYIKGSYQELHRVIWPSWRETVRQTFLVIGVSLAFAFILGAFDALFNYFLGILLSL
ncbi:MAG: preprotein translocase subunit SecE [Candidatus Portnoybacteria bacterium]|nr:preprotein translocase subunit SecE [Candidatus Portnoybacteria bacterium]